jgi:hypothetical protein
MLMSLSFSHADFAQSSIAPNVLRSGSAAERHESRRIDNQLRGRTGRQGDPGSTRFFLSLEDNIFRIFGGDRIQSMMKARARAQLQYCLI